MTLLGVQWLKLCHTSNVGTWVPFLVVQLRSHIPRHRKKKSPNFHLSGVLTVHPPCLRTMGTGAALPGIKCWLHYSAVFCPREVIYFFCLYSSPVKWSGVGVGEAGGKV